jgi:hypothetical protein
MAELIADILARAETRPSFDTTLTRSVKRYLLEHGKRTPAQLRTLQNIHTRCDIAHELNKRAFERVVAKLAKLQTDNEPPCTATPDVPYTLETLEEYWTEQAPLNAAWYEWAEKHCSCSCR